MEMILLLVAMFGIMYFLMIRPQQKKMKQDQEMRSQLAEGDRVLLTSGVFATIAHVGERQMIVELAPGVEITVLKGSVSRKVLAEDEEFEFTDDSQPSLEEPAVGEEHEELTAEKFDTMFDPQRPEDAEQADEAAVELESSDDEAKSDAVPQYQPWERNDATSAESNTAEEPRAEDTK